MKATLELLQELELETVPRLLVMNKVDRLPPEEAQHLAERYEAIAVSALDRTTLDSLRARLLLLCPAKGMAEAPAV
jgi:GTP-binding protein HflX